MRWTDVLACMTPFVFFFWVLRIGTANARREERERNVPTPWAWRPREHGDGIVECENCHVLTHVSRVSATIYPKPAPWQKIYLCPKCPDDDRPWSAAEAEKLMHARLSPGHVNQEKPTTGLDAKIITIGKEK